MAELTLSITTLRRFDACDLYKRVDDITRVMGRVLHEDEEIPLRVWWDLGTTSGADMWWSLRCLGEPGRRIGVEAACLAARRVLPLTREQDRPVCLAAIEAAEGWLRGEVTREKCRNAAGAARLAANAAATNAAATYAAYVARATYAPTYAADAAYAAYAAFSAFDAAAYAAFSAAAAAVEREKQRIDLYRITFGD